MIYTSGDFSNFFIAKRIWLASLCYEEIVFQLGKIAFFSPGYYLYYDAAVTFAILQQITVIFNLLRKK